MVRRTTTILVRDPKTGLTPITDASGKRLVAPVGEPQVLSPFRRVGGTKDPSIALLQAEEIARRERMSAQEQAQIQERDRQARQRQTAKATQQKVIQQKVIQAAVIRQKQREGGRQFGTRQDLAPTFDTKLERRDTGLFIDASRFAKPKPTFRGLQTRQEDSGFPIITKEERASGVAIPSLVIDEGDDVARASTRAGLITAKATQPPQSGITLGVISSGAFVEGQKRINIAEDIADTLIKFRKDPRSFIGAVGVKTTTSEVEGVISRTISVEDPRAFFGRQLGKDFETRAGIKARQTFLDLPTHEIIKSDIADVVVGASQLGIGIAEFGGTLSLSFGQQLVEPEQDLIFSKGFQFGDELGKITQIPVGGAGKLAQAGGLFFLFSKALASKPLGTPKQSFFQNSKQFLGKFSPLQIQSQVFTPIITSKTKFDAVVVKNKVGDLTGRVAVLKGTKDPITIISRQVTGKVDGKQIGVTQTSIVVPVTTFNTGTFKDFTRITTFEGFVGSNIGVGSTFSRSFIGGKLLKDLGFQGSVTDQFITPKVDVLFKTFPTKDGFGIATADTTLFFKQPFVKIKGGGVVETLPSGVKIFVGGRGELVRGLTISDSLIVDAPVGVLKVSPSIKGFEFNLKNLLGRQKSLGGLVIGDGGSSKALTQQLTQIVGAISQVSKITPTLPPTITTPSFPLIVGGVGGVQSQSEFFGQQFIVPPGTEQTIITITKLEQPSKTLSINLQRTSTDFRSSVQTKQLSVSALTQRQRNIVSTLPVSRSALVIKILQRQRVGLALRQQTRQRQIQKLELRTGGISPTHSGFQLPIPSTGIGIGGGFISLPEEKPSKRRRRPGSFTVSVRRGGRFKPIGVFGTSAKAFEVGAGKVGRTLAASFKVEGLSPSTKLPGGFRRSRREPGVIIERRGRRLSTGTETLEIQTAKRRKKKVKKKKGGRK